MNAEPANVLPWQNALWEKLTALHRDQRLPHALLLSGAPGVGKRQFASALARYLLCQTPGAGACGHCKSCQLYDRGTHPDAVWVTPEETGKAIRIDQIRELNHFLSEAAQQGGYRVSVIYPAEEMNINAANALLKALEEPGERTLFVLVSEIPGRMLATIRSRCQLYPVELPPENQALGWLQDQVEDAQTCRLLLGLAGGAPVRALELHQRDGLEQRRQWLKALAQVASGKLGAVDLAATWMKLELVELLDWWLAFMADLIRHQQAGEAVTLANLDARSLVPKFAARASGARLFDFRDKIQDYRLQLLSKANPNKQLLLEDLLLQWSLLFRNER
ncbi:DNA polymerase III subunit delta' [Motiliproteus sp. SC1-56]|uniref:DNA polymerase III subunit delta' n=1 Tax=Motiliproteus sp. SC1-56 TaxID=2799565 RepID=UPI001A8CC7E8|nr:DNA polymerase III subunit delta' [Motiliproteus sp. SC1-56]